MMEKLLLKMIMICVFLGFCEINAQFPGNRGMGGGGLDRNIGGGVRQNEPQQRQPVDYAKVMTANLTDKLKLDGFQSAIIKNLIEDFLKTNNNIMQENIPNDAKVEKTTIARNSMEKKFLEIFTDTQKALFQEFVNDNKGKVKKSKKKKKKNKTPDEDNKNFPEVEE
jgi:hypothetical protein